MEKIKTNTMALVLMSLLLFMTASTVPAMTSFAIGNSLVNQATAATPDAAPTEDCVNKMIDAMHSKASTLDDSKAIALAAGQSDLAAKTQGLTSKFNSIFNTWTLDPANCSVNWQDVNVVYSVSNATGYVKNVVVTEDPGLTRAISVSEQVGSHHSTT